MKVLLIDPPGRVKGLNIGFAFLVAVLKKENHEVKVLDFNNRYTTNQEKILKQTLQDFKPDIVGFTMLSLSYYTCMKLINYVKKNHNCKIVVGGAQTFIEQEKLLKDNKNIDVVIIGEGEETILELIKAFENKMELKDVKGIIFRNNGKIISTEKRPLIKDLDSLPFADYESLGIKYFNFEGNHTYPLLTSRGCPYNCSFCYSQILSNRSWRARKPECLIAELKEAIKKFDCNYFGISDDNFTLDVKRVEKFCDLLIKEKLNLKWSCMARADKLTEHLVKKMKLSGCERVQIGVESLIPEIFKEVDKGESIEDIKKAVKLFKKYKIKIYSFFIIGLPNDTFKGVMESYRLSKKIGFDFNSWQNLMPLPRTRAFEWVKKHGKIIRDYKDQSSVLEIGFETPEFTKEEREKAFNIISIKEKAYPFDPKKSNFQNGINTLKLILKYDAINLPSHIYKITKKATSILFEGRNKALSGIEFID